MDNYAQLMLMVWRAAGCAASGELVALHAHRWVLTGRMSSWGRGEGGAERVRPYLVKTVADAAQLWRELAGRTDDGLEKALRDLQKVPLVLLQVLTLLQPANRHGRFRESSGQEDLLVFVLLSHLVGSTSKLMWSGVPMTPLNKGSRSFCRYAAPYTWERRQQGGHQDTSSSLNIHG